MELHYKIYQKVRIYLDKIQYTLPNLETLKMRTMYAECESLISARLSALQLLQAELIDFCLKLKNSTPYVPSSRCKAIISWYGSNRLQSLHNFFDFHQDLIEADKEVTDEAGYIISDGNAPSGLKNLMKTHLERFKRVQEPERILKSN